MPKRPSQTGSMRDAANESVLPDRVRTSALRDFDGTSTGPRGTLAFDTHDPSVADAIDLQIYVTRVSHRGATMGTPDGPQREARYVAGAEQLYIAIGNSCVVESVYFPDLSDLRHRCFEAITGEAPTSILAELGVRLFESLFQGTLRDLYRELSWRASDAGHPLRITIATGSADLAAVPWEIMCDPYPQLTPNFLAHDRSIRLVRALRLYNRVRFRVAHLGSGGRLKVLVVTSAPERFAPIAAETDLQLLKFIASQEECAGRVTVIHCRNPTVDEFRSALYKKRPHVLHFAGHAGFDERRDLGVLCFSSTQRGGGQHVLH
jgi:hypothetical protein